MTKDMMIKTLSEYMAKNGGVMDLVEYKSHGNNVPVKDFLLRRAFGSWSRVLSVVKKRYPVQVAVEQVKEVKKPAPKKAVKKEVKDVE